MTCVLSCIIRLKFCFQSMYEIILRIIPCTRTVAAKYLDNSIALLIMAEFDLFHQSNRFNLKLYS